MQQSLFRLIYVSHAAKALDADALFLLLRRARRNNAPRGLTGILTFHEGVFLQILEGPKAAVEDIFARIVLDPRHHDVMILERITIRERVFAGWAMGWVDQADLRSTPLDPSVISWNKQSKETIDQMLAAFAATGTNT